LVNTVLATITANAFKQFADAIEAGQTPAAVAQAALKSSWKTIFNGNGYDAANQEMLTKAGLWRIDSGVDAICRYTVDKNVNLFSEMKVLTAEECGARQSVMLNHYSGTVEVETLALVDMIQQHILPSVRSSGVGPAHELTQAVVTLKDGLKTMHHASDEKTKAELARVLRLETMIKVREVCDAAEEVVPYDHWSLATYKELLFLDQTLE